MSDAPEPLQDAACACPTIEDAVMSVHPDPQTGTWSPRERELLEQLRSGRTVVVNMRAAGHPNLWRWANKTGVAVRIDRRSTWGNPFVIPADGDRDTVCDRYATEYWPARADLHAKVGTLAGKALGCWCAPLRCHGDLLAQQADANEVPS